MNNQACESGSSNDFFHHLSFPVKQRDSPELNFELPLPWQRVVDTGNPLLVGPAHFLLIQVGCSQLLKESEKPLQGEAPSGQNENLSSNSLGEDSASMGEFQDQED